jgi:hypothetical protein
MEAPLEIRYAGVVIGRAQEVRSAEGDPLSFFIPVRDPMPVGTVLHMRSGEQETPVRVVRALESTDAAACGMHVRILGEAEVVARDFIPPPVTAAEKIKVATPTPVVEVDLTRLNDVNDESPPATAAAADKTPLLTSSAAPVPASDAKATEDAPVQPASTPVQAAAVPDAVPVPVASSMTGALRNATESVQINAPIIEAATVPSGRTGEPASPQVTLSGTTSYTREYGSATESASAASESSAPVSGGQPAGEDLPPARPISGPSGRRKTKRRK